MSAPASNWTCPACGCYNPAEFKDCPCGVKPQQAPPPTRQRRRLPTWIAVLPALIAPSFYMIHAVTGMQRVSHAIEGSDSTTTSKTTPSGCVETYGITLSNSHEYVRSFSEFPAVAPRNPNAPRELSTILHGNVINHCGDPFRRVHLNITVRDEKGMRGKATVQVNDLKPGISQQFERVWIGQVATWEITPDQ